MHKKLLIDFILNIPSFGKKKEKRMCDLNHFCLVKLFSCF